MVAHSYRASSNFVWATDYFRWQFLRTLYLHTFLSMTNINLRLLSEHKSGKKDNRLPLFAEYMLNEKFLTLD